MTIVLGLVALHAVCAAIMLLLAVRAPVGRQDETGFVVLSAERQVRPSGRMASKPSYG